jgi:hypothetical protein
MSRKSKLGLAIFGISALGLTLAVSVATANAADVSAQINVIDGCAWALAGAPEEINLSAGEGVQYEGAELSMSYLFSSLSLGLAGSQGSQSANQGDSTECSFYSDVKNSKVELSLDTTSQFSATYGASTRDSLMDFGLTAEKPLSFTATALDSCPEDPRFSVASLESMYTTKMSPWNLIETNTVQNLFDPAVNQRCGIGLLMELLIPAYDGVPAGAGSNYSFAGPGLTISLVNLD